MIQSTVAIAVVLGGLIFFHELGHFILARIMGIGVHSFSLGFGPKIAGFRSARTNYKLALVPLGGYVHLAGETPDAELEDFPQEASFSLRPAWQRMLVVLAGPLFNFVLAFAIYCLLFMVQGRTELLPVIGEVKEGTPAAVAGIQPGDEVLTINGQEVDLWMDLVDTIQNSGGQPLVLSIHRGQETLEVTVTAEPMVYTTLFGAEKRRPLIGIQASGETRTVPVRGLDILVSGLDQTWAIISLTVEGLIKLIERIVPLESVGGPIMIAQMVSEQAKLGIFNVLNLTAIISINLGILNLLPIPILDGGHIFFYGVEAITGRPLSRRLQEVSLKVGLLLLITLMLLAVYNDILRLVRGDGPL